MAAACPLRSGQPVSACRFNHDGSLFAYGVSYDWSLVRSPPVGSCPLSPAPDAVHFPLSLQGVAMANPAAGNHLVIHPTVNPQTRQNECVFGRT